jgi:bifunctional non-homologous end joining protein LigD
VCKSSGKMGLHILVPLAQGYDTDQATQFAQLIAALVHRKLPDTTSLVRSPAQRQGRVYLDCLQNRRGQTLASAYSVRPYPSATVSTPLKWQEVKKGLNPAAFTIKTMAKRLGKVGDLWAPVLTAANELGACMKRLGRA